MNIELSSGIFRWRIKGEPVTILLDTGSNTSFINTTLARKFRLPINKTIPLIITVANGEKMCSEGKCVGVKLELQGHSFQVDLRVIDLGAYDVVLGMDWMKTISPGLH